MGGQAEFALIFHALFFTNDLSNHHFQPGPSRSTVSLKSGTVAVDVHFVLNLLFAIEKHISISALSSKMNTGRQLV
jgi:hypothetical protein